MSAGFTQESRLISVAVDGFEADDLLLTSFSGTEELSRSFRYQLDVWSTKLDVAPADVIGKKIDFTVKDSAGKKRFFNGYASELISGQYVEAGRAYQIVVVPWLWFLTQTTDCRIFQDKTVVQIIEAVLGECALAKFKKVLGQYNPRLFCVQYNESDFDFVSRLMEEAGIYYYFEHEEGDHTLVLADAATGYFDLTEDEVEYRTGSHTVDHITAWRHAHVFHPGAWALTEYDFQNPTTKLLASSKTTTKLADTKKYEVFEYPGGLAGKQDAKVAKYGDSKSKELTTLRLAEQEAAYDVVEGAGGCTSFSPGGKFKLLVSEVANHPDKDATFVIRSIEHSASDDTYHAGDAGSAQYSSSFTCISDAVVFRPPQRTPRPYVKGPQTAVVVGPTDSEIYTDEYGRVKVLFHWDREGAKKDAKENSSCWMRVSQGWAGENWGMLFTPRVGQEVIVSFLEGDPDRPIITGRVYNADMMPPYTLPDEQTKSGIVTRSTLKGDAKLFNELRFDDKKESEHIYFHAERDFQRVVENNDELEIGFKWKKPGDRKVKIHNNHELTIGNDKADDGSQTISVWKNRTGTIHKGNDELTISTGYGKTTAEEYIEMIVGESSIKIEPSKITLSSATIVIEGTGEIQAEAKTTKVTGTAELKLKGGKVAIN